MSFEHDVAELVDKKREHSGKDDWRLQPKVKISRDAGWFEEDVGDSCCFGTRTVEFGVDCIWRLHGGV